MGKKCIIEHWRDGECIERFEFTNETITAGTDGEIHITFPPGSVVLATEDELRFNLQDAIDVLNRVQP